LTESDIASVEISVGEFGPQAVNRPANKKIEYALRGMIMSALQTNVGKAFLEKGKVFSVFFNDTWLEN
jgi:hypothetical protein